MQVNYYIHAGYTSLHLMFFWLLDWLRGFLMTLTPLRLVRVEKHFVLHPIFRFVLDICITYTKWNKYMKWNISLTLKWSCNADLIDIWIPKEIDISLGQSNHRITKTVQQQVKAAVKCFSYLQCHIILYSCTFQAGKPTKKNKMNTFIKQKKSEWILVYHTVSIW